MTEAQLRAWLAKPRVADGAWSSRLRLAGALQKNEPAEFLNRRSPEAVLALARDYVRAGVDLLTTNTFAATRAALAQRGHADPAAAVELCRAGVHIARQAAKGHEALIAGVLGPSGAILAVQELSDAELTTSFAESAAALAESGADLIVLETFSELREAIIAIAACKAASKLPVVACLSFDSGPQRTRTIAGIEATDAATPLLDAGATLVGANCGAARQPVWLKPSACLPELLDDQLVYSATPDEFARPIRQWIDAGAAVVGGCCGVGPEHIKRVAREVAKLRDKPAARRQKPLA